MRPTDKYLDFKKLTSNSIENIYQSTDLLGQEECKAQPPKNDEMEKALLYLRNRLLKIAPEKT